MIKPWDTRKPDLVADVMLYATEKGGGSQAIKPIFGCLCFTSKSKVEGGWEARLQLNDEPLEPDIIRRVGFVFLSEEGADSMKCAGLFYLWAGSIIGEARVVE